MSTLVQSLRRYGPFESRADFRIGKRWAVVAGAITLISIAPDGWSVTLPALSEAYLAVTVFVAGTLALVYFAERAFKTDLGVWLQRYRRWQVLVAALLGAFPGCGGAIIAVTQYTRGYLSFGGVVATLTATMGDAMFLLLAREPQTAVGVLVLGIVIGAATGYLIDAVHGPGFMRPARGADTQPEAGTLDPRPAPLRTSERIWVGLVVPGLVIGVLAAFQVEVDTLLKDWTGLEPAYWLGVAGAVLAVAMWVREGEASGSDCGGAGVCPTEAKSVARSVIDTTNFVTAWVVLAFVGYELIMSVTGFDLGAVLSVWGPLVPAMAVLIGLVPGCGPQILVTTLYLSGAVPLSAQLANAMANDGDALFPAIAVAPKAALMATLYSAIPALASGYGWYFLMETAV